MRNPIRTNRAFTLIELLTVIAIIGVLAALLFPAIKSALLKAEVGKAQTAMSGLETAIKTYQTEYGRWPASTTGPGGVLYTTNWFVALLRGEDKTGSEDGGIVTYYGNPRRISFLQFKNQDLIINPANNTTNFVDPWRNLYELVFDASYSNLATNPFNNPVTLERVGYLIWSKGPNAQESSYANTGSPVGDGNGVNKDNVKTW